jgi:hypothetical protein
MIHVSYFMIQLMNLRKVNSIRVAETQISLTFRAVFVALPAIL